MFTQVKHKIYGRGKVDSAELATSDPMITFHIDTPRDTTDMKLSYKVGKVALDDRGGYIPKKRQNSTRIEQYLPLVSGCVAALKRPEDDWDELYAVGSIGLVEADARFSKNSNYAFASFAKPYIMGYIKNTINPTRNGDMNQVPLVEGFDIPTEPNAFEDVWRAFYLALEHMNKKQAQVMKLLFIEGHNLQNAADIMGFADHTSVRDYRDRALVHVRKKLGTTGT